MTTRNIYSKIFQLFYLMALCLYHNISLFRLCYILVIYQSKTEYDSTYADGLNLIQIITLI
jgi:hypothetical protein